MDNFRRSNVSLSQANQSHLGSPDRVPSVYESRARYETEQLDLVRYLRWVIVLIGAIVAALFLKALLGAQRPQRCVEASPATKLREYFVPNGSAASTAESFWAQLLPSRAQGGLGGVQDRLRTQRFSVTAALPELPSTESIRANPAHFNLSLAELDATPVERLTARFPAAQVLAGLQTLIGGPEVGAEAGAAELERSRADISAQLRRLDELERLLQHNTTAELVLKLNDLRGSGQALTAKRAQLNDLRARFLAAARVLTDCEDRERERDASLASDRQLAAELREKLSVLDVTAAELKRRIEEKEQSLSESDRENRERILALTTRAAQLKANLARRPAVERAIAEKRQREQQLSAEVARLQARLNELGTQRAALESDHQRFMAQPRELQTELEAFEAKKRIVSMRLNSMLTHRQIKTLLATLVPARDQKTALKSIMDEKLSEEKELLETVQRYQADGAAVSAEPEDLRRQIERDQTNFKQILEKYAEWQKVVDDYDASDEDITVVQVQMQEVEEKVLKLQLRLGEFKGKQDVFAERLRALDEGVAAAQARVAEAEAEGRSIASWILQTGSDLAGWQDAWQTLQAEIDAKNSEFAAYKANVEQSFGDLDKQRESVHAAVDEHRAQLAEVLDRAKAASDRLAAARGECAAVKALYAKVSEMLPTLQALFGHDLRVFAQLKKELAALTEPFAQLLS